MNSYLFRFRIPNLPKAATLQFAICNLKSRLSLSPSHPITPSVLNSPYLRVSPSPHQFLSLPLSASPRHPIFLFDPSPGGQTVLHVLQT
jgi:hypothetical protein